MESHENDQEDGETLAAKPKTKLKRPSFYWVMLMNDDYTPMDFVVKVLEEIYHKSPDEAYRIMVEVHEKGSGICGIYTREVAETKVDQTLQLASQYEHPLQCVMEKEG